jgi:hypothetical protein
MFLSKGGCYNCDSHICQLIYVLKYSILDCFIWLKILLRNKALGVMFGLTIF